MAEVLLKIESEGREGVLAVGSYLIDAAGRLGTRIEDDPQNNNGEHSCSVIVESGGELLSEITETERRHFERTGRKPNERLACQSKFIKPGEVVIMTDEKKVSDEKVEAEEADRFRKEFEEMPLEKKIANLLQLEIIAVGETVKFVLDSPYKLFDKVMDVMAEFGMKKDEDAKKAARPKEHAAAAASESAGDANTAATSSDIPAVG